MLPTAFRSGRSSFLSVDEKTPLPFGPEHPIQIAASVWYFADEAHSRSFERCCGGLVALANPVD